MTKFRDEQWERVCALMNTLKLFLEHKIIMVERRADMRVMALEKVLFHNGIVLAEEVLEARKEIEAGYAVEEALDPEIQAAFEKFNRQVREILGEEGTEEET